MQLEDLCRGRRVLFVNAIRTDQPSGGNSSSQLLLGRLRATSELRELKLGPDSIPARLPLRMLMFVLASLPAVIFIALLRATGKTWLEFFIRASPWYVVRCLAARMSHRPEIVLFNHHPTFVYVRLFGGARRVLLWHDVPSLKRDESVALARSARHCAALERMFIRHASSSMTFSFTDAKLLRRLHRSVAGVLPVVQASAEPRERPVRKDALLLVGNWHRAENCDGAIEFFDRLAARAQAPAFGFHVAGNGADGFVDRLLSRNPTLRRLAIASTGRYGRMCDFDELALLAPLSRGAGIKLKTIEAWCAGIPVVGTTQAFTGMSASIWRPGGLKVDSIDSMVELCIDGGRLQAACAALAPLRAFENYQDALGCVDVR
jgi:hypothetical protein